MWIPDIESSLPILFNDIATSGSGPGHGVLEEAVSVFKQGSTPPRYCRLSSLIPHGNFMAQTLSISHDLPAIPPFPAVEDINLLQDNCRTMIKDFLKDCGIPYHARELDQGLFSAAYDSASKWGCCMSGPHSLVPALRVGTSIGLTSYRHREFDVQLFATLFTAYATYMDDMCARDASLVSNFVDTFILHQPQGHPVLDAFAALLLEMPEKFDKVVSNLMVTSSLNLITAWLLEAEIPHMSLPPTAYKYASYVRSISGAPDVYCLFIFPRDLPRASYIHALPDIGTFINFANDILSFYKEELLAECSNYMSVMATTSRTSKHDVLKNTINETATAYKRATETLSSNPKALEAFQKFAHGYVEFHASDPRYRLSELKLQY